MTRVRRPSGLVWRTLALVVCSLLPLPLRAADTWQGVERIVAIGDVHGDYGQFVMLLRAAGLIDENQDWIGAESHLVQTGDVPDRGPDTRKVLDLLMKLEKQAKKKKGFVHCLIGNHEAMNVYGDLRYIHPGEFEAFAGPRSAEIRDKMYERHVQEVKRNPPPKGLPSFGRTYREQWDKAHPLGYFEHRLNFGPAGKYGKWISKHNVIIKINDILFLHGGLSPKYAASTVREINDQAREELRDFAKLQGGLVTDSEGPLWYRGLALSSEDSEDPEAANLAAVLTQFDAKRMVLGHTVTEGAVMPRFDGRVLLIDVGMSAVYGGRSACLLVENDKFYAIHRGARLPLPEDSDIGLLQYLKQAAALDPAPSPLQKKIAALEAKLAVTASH